MKIVCTGPGGTKFEGEITMVRPAYATVTSISAADEHNAKERAGIQRALETWCKVVGANPIDATPGAGNCKVNEEVEP